MVTRSELEGFAERLNHALDLAGYPLKGRGRQQLVGKAFGVSQKGARKWLEGEGMPTQARLVLICRNLDVSHEWLVTGRPPMRPGIAEPHEPYNSMPRLTDEERLHLDRFRAADAIHRRLSDLALLMDDQPGNEDVHLGKKKVGNARP